MKLLNCELSDWALVGGINYWRYDMASEVAVIGLRKWLVKDYYYLPEIMYGSWLYYLEEVRSLFKAVFDDKK